MSVLLQAGNLALKTARDKQNKKKKRKLQVIKCSKARCSFNTTPPKSTPKTMVWHWELDGVPTTVMLSTQTNGVWCNGQTLDTIDEFAECDGAVLDFCILTEETRANHKARIKRTKGAGSDDIVHHLYVDGHQVSEHGGQPLPGASAGPDGAGAADLPEYRPPEDVCTRVPPFLSDVPNPPRYEDVFATIQDKKND